MNDNQTIAERLRSLSLRMQMPNKSEIEAAGKELQELVISLDPLASADDALAMQCLAMDLAHMIADGMAPAGSNIMELMRCASIRVARYLETTEGATQPLTGFFDFNSPVNYSGAVH